MWTFKFSQTEADDFLHLASAYRTVANFTTADWLIIDAAVILKIYSLFRGTRIGHVSQIINIYLEVISLPCELIFPGKKSLKQYFFSFMKPPFKIFVYSGHQKSIFGLRKIKTC